MPLYTVYGLKLKSEMALPELVRSDGPAEVIIRNGVVDRQGLEPPVHGGSSGRATLEEATLWFEAGGLFQVRGGREIVIERNPDADDSAVRLFLLGPVLGVLLHQRGVLVLHASAAIIGGRAVAFVAEKGTGKSTLAAAFHAAGHGIVADDLVAVDLDAPNGPMAHPGFPQLKLYPEAAAQLGDGADALPKLLPDFDKRARRSADGFPDKSLPIRHVYVLTNGEQERITPLAPQQAFLELVRHSFLLSILKATGTQAFHFRQAVRLASLVKVQKLERRRSLTIMPDVVRMVEDDCVAP